jgi:hypothetical protein
LKPIGSLENATIPQSYTTISVAEITYDLSHLNAFKAFIPGKGIEVGSDLLMYVCFSNHVFTERAKHGEEFHALDHYGTRRKFDPDRYEMSKSLKDAIKSKIEQNDLTFVSQSFGGTDNLVFIELENGATWSVVYCLQPLQDNEVGMEILSSHPKVIDQKKISRKQISYFARKCLYDKTRTQYNG